MPLGGRSQVAQGFEERALTAIRRSMQYDDAPSAAALLVVAGAIGDRFAVGDGIVDGDAVGALLSDDPHAVMRADLDVEVGMAMVVADQIVDAGPFEVAGHDGIRPSRPRLHRSGARIRRRRADVRACRWRPRCR